MYSLKNLKNFKGHEGEPLCQGTLHGPMGKVADWSDDSNGGQMRIDFTARGEQDKFEAFARTYLVDKPNYDGKPYEVATMASYDLVESAITDMCNAAEEEKLIAKHVKKGIVYYLPDPKTSGEKVLYAVAVPYTAANVAKLRVKEPALLEIVNETMKLPFEDASAFELAARNKQYKRECKTATLFTVREPDGTIKSMVRKAPYSALQATQLRAKYPNLVEIINERFL